jgi:threonine synthase
LDHSGVWRFRELLPILESFGNVVTLFEGSTPLYHLPRAAKALGIDQLFAKHQGMNPTGSFKDTGMTAAMSVAKERGFEWVACASTGNTSAAMAAYAARAGLKSLVLIPDGKIAWGKLSQAMDFGALTCQLKADFDGCLTPAVADCEGSADLSAQFRESLPAGGPENPRLRDCRGLRLERSRPPDRARRQSRQ